MESRNLMGISSLMTKEIKRRRFDRESGAIVFDGPTNVMHNDGVTNVMHNDGVIHFPSGDDDYNKRHSNADDEEIDLSASFKPSKQKINSPNIFTTNLGTFANCGVSSPNAGPTSGSASSGVFTYPNGTQVSFSNCQVIQTANIFG